MQELTWLEDAEIGTDTLGGRALLHRISRLLYASTLIEVYNDMLVGACQLTGGNTAWLLLAESGSEVLQLSLAWGDDLRGKVGYIALGQGLAGQVAQRQATAFAHLHPDAALSPYSDLTRSRYALAIPLLRADCTLLGVVQVDSDQPFNPTQIAELRYFLRLSVVATERVGVMEDLSAGVVSMSVIGTLYSVLNAEVQIGTLEQEVVDYAAKQVEGDLCLLAIVNSEVSGKARSRQRRWRVGGLSHNPDERQAEIGRIMATPPGDEPFTEEQLARALVQNRVKVNDLLIKPLESRQRQLGTIYAVRLADHPRYSEREKSAFAYYTSAAAIALDNAILLADNRARLEQIIELKELNENIIRQMGSGVITCDLDGKLTMMNHAAEGLLAWPSEQAIGRVAVDVLGLSGYERSYCMTMLNDRASGRHEVHLRTNDDHEVVAELSATPLTDTTGKHSGMIVLLNDLTIAREQEAERKRVERLDAIAKMAAHVAHEMRNPLGVINLLAQNLNMMLDSVNDDQRAERADSMRRLQKQVGRLSSMLNEILNFSRPPQLQFTAASIPHIINQALRNHTEILFKHHIRVQEDYDPNLPTLMLDCARLEAVFDNLVRNAAQAMNGGGTLHITAQTLPTDDADSCLVQVIVTDTGSGISDEVLPHIFEPFYTNKAQGTGLGLAIVHRFVEEHNGTVAVDSTVGQGTSFTIHLRLKPAAA